MILSTLTQQGLNRQSTIKWKPTLIQARKKLKLRATLNNCAGAYYQQQLVYFLLYRKNHHPILYHTHLQHSSKTKSNFHTFKTPLSFVSHRVNSDLIFFPRVSIVTSSIICFVYLQCLFVHCRNDNFVLTKRDIIVTAVYHDR